MTQPSVQLLQMAQGEVEAPAYVDQGGDQLYIVHHEAVGACRGAVLLVGPLALERTHAYLVWVRWARTLARAGFAALRFDFRGVGESTRQFAECGFEEWEADVATCAAHLARLCPGVPLVLHGLRFGALPASHVFARGVGDGLLLWDPATAGAQHLGEALRRKVAADNMESTGEGPKTREHHIAALERGEQVEVEGYPWSRRTWTSGQGYDLDLGPGEGGKEGRPRRIVYVDGRPPERFAVPGCCASVRLARPFFWNESKVLRPDVDELFSVSIDWLAEVSRAHAGAGRS